MCEPALRLAILLIIFFGCLGAIEESIYLAIAVVKIPLLTIVPVGLVAGFLTFVGKRKLYRYG